MDAVMDVDYNFVNEGKGDIILGENVIVHPTARFNISEYLYIGDYSQIGEGCEIKGRDIRIGQEFYMGAGAKIGGGSCFERQSKLRAGHFLHMGEGSFINTARPVKIGNEVGLGMGTKLFTHGAYLSALDGFPVAFGPVTLGDNVWLPGAIVNPGVTIGSNVVVGVNSLVSRDLPDGCLAAGSPAKVIKENVYPAYLDWDARLAWWPAFSDDYPDQPLAANYTGHSIYVSGSDTVFHPEHHVIRGEVTETTERLRNQLRRYGIRFYSRPTDGEYRDWR